MVSIDTEKLAQIIKRNIEEFHRRIFILEEEALIYLLEIIRVYTDIRKSSYSLLISGKEDKEDSNWLTIFLNELKEFIDEGVIRSRYVSFKNLERIMGSTWDFLIVDLRKDFRPDDLGRLIEVVRGGGLIIFLIPMRSKWVKMITPFHKNMITKPYTENDLNYIFIRYFISTLESIPGIFFVDAEGTIVGEDFKSPPVKRPILRIPKDITFDRDIYNICYTQDQIDLLYAIDKMNGHCGSIVVTADRGRGKSAALGLGISGYIYKNYVENNTVKIVVTAPDPINVREIFDFIARVFYKKKIKFNAGKRNGVIVSIDSKLGHVFYLPPLEVFHAKFDLAVVDEASGIPVGLLNGYAEKYDFTIFSTTLHGYEGAGRGFQIRFLPILKKLKKENYIEIHMTQPIRYNEFDPVETWIYKALFLDSDPAELPEKEINEIFPKRTRYVKMNLEEWLFKKENKLREYIGIYIYAHYRNRPNDIMILCDAPHHFARCLTYKGHVVNSLHLCFEGKMNENDIRKTLSGESLSGNLIPSVIIRYYPPFIDFTQLSGVRIVRIATHPQLMNRGIGSKALEKVVREGIEKKVDWIGSSFGATEQLLNFWVKNGFYPIYLSPIRNPISGEFSTIVIKPLTSRAITMVKNLRVEFKKLLLETLIDSHFILREKLAYTLLSSDIDTIFVTLNLSENQIGRLKEYVYGALHYGGAYDAIRELVKTHFLRSVDKRVSIPRKYEYALISKVLQVRSWEKVSRESGVDRKDLILKFREYIGKMRLNYIANL